MRNGTSAGSPYLTPNVSFGGERGGNNDKGKSDFSHCIKVPKRSISIQEIKVGSFGSGACGGVPMHIKECTGERNGDGDM